MWASAGIMPVKVVVRNLLCLTCLQVEKAASEDKLAMQQALSQALEECTDLRSAMVRHVDQSRNLKIAPFMSESRQHYVTYCARTQLS